MERQKFLRLSSHTIEVINEQFHQICAEFKIPPEAEFSIDHSTYYFLNSTDFGLSYLLSDILELHEKSDRQECCLEIWKQFNTVRKSKEVLDSYVEFQNILEHYFTVIPNLFSKESKEILEKETIQLITRTITELDDERVATILSTFSAFQEWLRQYYTFHEDGKVISGFRGKSLHYPEEKHAIFLNKSEFASQRQKYGENRAIGFHCHTVIHETMHLRSFNSKGFSNWNASKVTKQSPQPKLDEGFTELFARLIVYRIQRGVANGTITMDAREVPQLVTHDYIGNLIPVYEPLKLICTRICEEVGLSECAEAYFRGNFDPFTAKLLSIPLFNNEYLWKPLSVISHSSAVYTTQQNRVDELKAAGLTIDGPKEISDAVNGGTWVDPLLEFFGNHGVI